MMCFYWTTDFNCLIKYINNYDWLLTSAYFELSLKKCGAKMALQRNFLLKQSLFWKWPFFSGSGHFFLNNHVWDKITVPLTNVVPFAASQWSCFPEKGLKWDHFPKSGAVLVPLSSRFPEKSSEMVPPHQKWSRFQSSPSFLRTQYFGSFRAVIMKSAPLCQTSTILAPAMYHVQPIFSE